MSNVSRFQLLIVMVLSSVSLNSHAINCNKESPTKLAEGDNYPIVKNFEPLTREERHSIRSLFKAFNRTMKGKLTRIECAKTANLRTYIQTTRENIKADIRVTRAGEVLMEMDVSNLKNRTDRLQTQRYFTKDSVFAIRSITNTGFSVSTKAKRAGLHKGSHLHEAISELRMSENSVSIITTEYINGYFSLMYSILLKK